MGLLSFFARKKALTASPDVLEAWSAGVSPYPARGGTNQRVSAAWQEAQSATYGWTYQNQPAVRMVVDFIARNTAQLGLKLYERVSDTDREPRRDHPAAVLMSQPNDFEPADKFIKGLVSDYLVHDNAYALKLRPGPGAPLMMVRLPASSVAVNGDARFTVDSYTVYRSDGSTLPPVPASDMLHWRDYNPDDPRLGFSRLQTLADVLAEDAAAQTAQVELLKAGLGKPGYIERPLEAPEWSQEDRERFMEMWANAMKGSARKTPVLDEGMKFADFGVSPKDAEMLEGRRFTIEEVCQLYGVLPAALGIGSGDSEKATRRFYADVLAPLTTDLAAQLDFSLLLAEWDDTEHYFEFDLNTKLAGDIEKRFPMLTASVGAPWLTRNEARAKENLPPIDGGDELITPLNVTVGSNPKPAPNVMGPQDPNKPSQDGDYREASQNGNGKAVLLPRARAFQQRKARYQEEATEMMRRHFNRQESSKRLDWARFDRELADDLYEWMLATAVTEGAVWVQRLGGQGFDPAQREKYFRAAAEDAAQQINEATRNDLAGGKDDRRKEAFERARGERAPTEGSSFAGRVMNVAATDTALNSPGAEFRMKTWIPNTERHAANAATVPINQPFPNGGSPGTAPNCMCVLDIA